MTLCDALAAAMSKPAKAFALAAWRFTAHTGAVNSEVRSQNLVRDAGGIECVDKAVRMGGGVCIMERKVSVTTGLWRVWGGSDEGGGPPGNGSPGGGLRRLLFSASRRSLR